MNYRAAVGPEENYDIIGAYQFMLMVMLGLREHHTLLDIGCGSLRGGRFFIPYLNPGCYYGVEPNERLVLAGLRGELGCTMSNIMTTKLPVFSNSRDFDFSGLLIQTGAKNFDYILAQSILSHTSPGMMMTCLRNAYDVMHGDSVFAFTFMPGDDYKGPEGWIANGKVASYKLDTIRRRLDVCGFFSRHVEFPHPSGQVWIVATKSVPTIDKCIRRLKRWSGQICQ